MSPEAIDDAVAIYVAARRRETRIEALPEHCRPGSIADAYAVQETLNRRLAKHYGAVAGYKIGCTTPVMQRYLEIDHPCAGALYAGRVHNGHAVVPHDAYWRPGVECEIAVRLGATLAAAHAPFDATAVAAAVQTCSAAIEIVDDRFVDFRALDTPTLLADDFFSAGCVVGSVLPDWRAQDLRSARGTMTINGREVGSGTGADVMDHPFNALAWLATSLAERGIPLRAGDTVMTGSVVETNWVEPGDHVHVAIEGLGEASVTFAA